MSLAKTAFASAFAETPVFFAALACGRLVFAVRRSLEFIPSSIVIFARPEARGARHEARGAKHLREELKFSQGKRFPTP